MELRLGTRASALAITQSELVADRLRALGHDVELARIRTGGDVEKGSLTRLGSLGVFAAELRTAILDGRCDFAVHSLKDLPTAAVPGLIIAAVPGREDPSDALCAGGRTLASLPAGATVGTGSPRRVAQLRRLRPDLRYVDVRGNVGTRLARVADGDLDAVVLAAAGLRRLGLEHEINDLLPILPAPGQGALALECRENAEEVLAALRELDDPDVHRAVDAERAVLAGLGGGCAAPIAAHASDGVLRAGVFSVDGASAATSEVPLGEGSADQAVQELLALGADRVTDLAAARESRLADLHDDASLWRGDVTLAGAQVLLPRPDGPLADGLRAAGAEVTTCPVQRTVTLPVDGTLEGADWVILTSPATLPALAELGLTIPASARVAAVGEATAEAVRRAGHSVDLVPRGQATAAALVDAFPPGPGRVAVPGSALSSPTLATGLEAKGYAVTRLPVYTVEPVERVPEAVQRAWDSGQFDVVVITAGSVGEAFASLLGWRDDVAVVAFGPPSEAALRDAGVPVAATAETQDADGLVQAIGRVWKR